MFSHIFVSVSDFERALNFYTQVLAKLNIEQRFCDPEKPWAGWHSSGGTRPYFVICKPFNGEPHDAGNGQMVAFTAADRESVCAAYQTALSLGGLCEGPPGLRPRYHKHYFGAYFRDLDGNKICVACHTPVSPSIDITSAGGMNILAISGSLRTESINAAFLRAVAQAVPSSVQLVLYEGLGSLPFFNPDLESAPPEQVVQWRSLVAQADALLIASPEYAHGVTGTIKNALDWLVSHEPFVNKPIAVINTSPRAHHADAALRETLITMNANLVESASITVPLLGGNINLQELAQTELLINATQLILEGLHATVANRT